MDNVKKHISNESVRLANELTSYSNNYQVFENTLTNIKNNIYNQLHSTILSVVIDFNGQLINKFYNNYIEKYLQDLEEETEKEKFGQYDFLNTTLYLNKTMNQMIKSLINKYKNLTLTQIEYLKNLNSQQLDSLFSFISIKNKINNEINAIYKSKLLPSLKTYAIYTSGDEGVKEYDFPTSISNNIDNLLNSKINQTQQIINKMKGKNYIINNEEWKIPDFSLVTKNEFNSIETKFKQFCDAYYTQDLKEIKNVVFKNVNNNFNLFIDSFIPSFGKDFYDRILKYNEIQKIKSLYGNLKYSLTITLIYYIGLCSLHTSKYFPKDLKEKILSLNNIESIVKSKNNKVISTLNSKIDQFFENNKNYLVEKYITQMKDDPYIISSFNQKIKQYIDDILEGKRNVFEDEFIYMMNTYIKEPFVKQYSNTLNKESQNMLYFIEQNKEVTKVEFNTIFTLNTQDVIIDIENQLYSLVNAVDNYNTHFNSFTLPDEVINYLNNYVFNEIKPKYEEIKNIIDIATKDLILSNLDQNSLFFMESYSLEKFESKNQEANYNLTGTYNNITESLKSYGLIEDKYIENLDKEITKYLRIRRLDDLDEGKISYSKNVSDIKVEQIFGQIMNDSLKLKEFVDTLNLFNEFDQKIKKHINDINYQYTSSKNKIEKYKDYHDDLNEKLEELYYYSINYYNNANLSYHKTKEFIFNLIDNINSNIEKCTNITFNVISKKYIEIKDKYQAIMKSNKDSSFYQDENDILQDGKSYYIAPEIEHKTNNEFLLDVILLGGNIIKTQVVGSVANNNRPEKFEIDFYSKVGKKCRIGRKIKVIFNNMTLLSNFSFKGGDNKILINNILDVDEYEVKTEFYEEKEKIDYKTLGGITYPLGVKCIPVEIGIPEGEFNNEIIKSKKKELNITYSY